MTDGELVGPLDELYQTAYDEGFKAGEQKIAVKWQAALNLLDAMQQRNNLLENQLKQLRSLQNEHP